MPSRMIHYFIAEKVARQVPITCVNRFKIGSICPDMSTREDDSKNRTHYLERTEKEKGVNWQRFVERYSEGMRQDDFYLGVLCHLITDGIWFHDIMEPRIRSKIKTKEERLKKYLEGYSDFHRLNYILQKEFHLNWALEEDRNIELEGLHDELYDDVFGGLYRDFFEEPPATKEELTIYHFEPAVSCIELCIEECVKAINAFRQGIPMGNPGKYYVPLRKE